jgi:hypothetical protein
MILRMKKTLPAALFVALAAVLVPSFAAADPGSAVQADLTQLSTDLQAAHDTLVADFGTVGTAAQAGDKTGAIAAIEKARSAAQALLPAVQKDRLQLRADVKLARAANVTGLASEVKTAIKGDRGLSKDIRQARRDARKAIRSLRHSKS